jgi:hypothetical protein
MQNLIRKVQDLGQKAALVKQAVESAPARAAEVRAAVLSTAAQLHQLRSEVQQSVTSLRAGNDEQLAQSLREIADQSALFRQTGYHLDSVEMELGLMPRLVVRLERIETVPTTRIQFLLESQTHPPTTQAILKAILKAQHTAEQVDLPNLAYRRLVIYAGSTPSVQLGWHATTAPRPTSPAPGSPPAPPLLPTTAPSARVTPPAQTQTPPNPPATAPSPAPTIPTTNIPAPTPLPPSAPKTLPLPTPIPAPTSIQRGWKPNALDRFKKMPDFSKAEHP